MKLHHDTLASAAVFYHRFYQIHSFSKFRSRYVTATCCLFLAGKVEETPKKWTGKFIHSNNMDIFTISTAFLG